MLSPVARGDLEQIWIVCCPLTIMEIADKCRWSWVLNNGMHTEYKWCTCQINIQSQFQIMTRYITQYYMYNCCAVKVTVHYQTVSQPFLLNSAWHVSHCVQHIQYYHACGSKGITCKLKRKRRHDVGMVYRKYSKNSWTFCAFLNLTFWNLGGNTNFFAVIL